MTTTTVNNKLSPLPNNIHNHNNNSNKSELNNLKSGVSLDAAALVKQSSTITPTTNNTQKYANITTGDNNKTGNGVIQNGPYNNNPNYINNTKKYINDNEITC